MGYKRYTKRKREKSLQTRAFPLKKKHDTDMEGKKVILVPHPDYAKTWIEKIVDE